MSHEATNWAWKQPVPNSGAKFVLLAMSNRANPDQRGRVVAFTSIKYLADATAQDRKTVVTNLARLREWGLIEDTGERVGKTKQVPVYELRCPPDLFSEYTQNRNSSENGPVPKFPAKSPVFPSKQAQKRDTDSALDSSSDSRASVASGSRLPLDWSPSDEDLAFARRERPEIDANAEAAKFRDYWVAAPGAKGRRADWPATWRNWIRRADAPKAAPGQPVTGSRAPAAPQRDWREASESPLQREIAHIQQLHSYGALGDGLEADTERERLIAEARNKHAHTRHEEFEPA
ncbi:hypothetical protein WCE39_08075 [Luteimonas sp. MJ174]|uniref:hypothetical protein n=1 Tax=Luteimonas sp. MJ174 TaxID=3129237 RepID=UPI0031BA367D